MQTFSLATPDESLRWPKRLDRAAMVARLGAIREAAEAEGLYWLADLFEGVDLMPAATLGKRVIEAMEWLDHEHEPCHSDFCRRLSIVALNLKYLK